MEKLSFEEFKNKVKHFECFSYINDYILKTKIINFKEQYICFELIKIEQEILWYKKDIELNQGLINTVPTKRNFFEKYITVDLKRINFLEEILKNNDNKI